LGVLNGTYALSTIAGPLLGGWLADRSGLGIIPWSSLAFASVATVMAWRSVFGGERASEAEAAQGPGRNGD